MDESDLHTHPHLVQVWQRRGDPRLVPAAGKDERRAVFGALDYASGRMTWRIHDRKGGDVFAAFLDQVAQAWPDEPIVLVLDNVSYHRSPAVRAWWAAQEGRIIPFWLPAYAPALNLIERVWRFVKHKLACHRFWADVAGLEATAAALLAQVEARFHTEATPAIRLAQNFCEPA